MIVSHAPLRITLGGGGSDLHPNGLCVTATIDKFVSVAVTDNFADDYLIRYSETERCAHPADIVHPLVRRAIAHYAVNPGVEITSFADIPAGTGLGSSGAFAVALCHALSRHIGTGRRQFAETARFVDPVGWQDQYSAAYGGLTMYAEGSPPHPILVGADTWQALNDNLILFYTGTRRASADVLPIASTDPVATRAIALTASRALELGDMEAFAGTLTAQWDLKYEAHPSLIHSRADFAIKDAIDRGFALGGKLVGAGDGGFILFYSQTPEKLRKAITLREVPFSLEPHGVR